MSVEGGSIGGAGGIGGGGGGGIATGVSSGVGTSVGGGIEAGGLAGAASVSGLSIAAPSFEAASVVAGSIINEGPVGLADLKATVPLQAKMFNPVGEIRFNEPLSVPDVLAEAESIISQAQKSAVSSPVIPSETRDLKIEKQEFGDSSLIVQSDRREVPNSVLWIPQYVKASKKMEPAILPLVEPVIAPFVIPNGLEYPKTENALAVQSGSQPKTESRVSAKVTQAVSAQPAAKEQAAEKAVIEEVDTKEAVKTQDQEQIKRIRLGLVEDTPKTRTREDELSQAIELVATEAKVLGVEGIEGWRIVNKLIPQHSGDRSETLNEEDPQNTIPDGSWESVKEDIRTRKFTSLEEARKVTSVINRKYRPEKKGEEDDITEEEHQRVHKDHKHPSRRPLQILERRIVRKEKQASLGQNTEPVMIQEAAQSKQETNLEELNPTLAEVFPKH